MTSSEKKSFFMCLLLFFKTSTMFCFLLKNVCRWTRVKKGDNTVKRVSLQQTDKASSDQAVSDDEERERKRKKGPTSSQWCHLTYKGILQHDWSIKNFCCLWIQSTVNYWYNSVKANSW